MVVGAKGGIWSYTNSIGYIHFRLNTPKSLEGFKGGLISN